MQISSSQMTLASTQSHTRQSSLSQNLRVFQGNPDALPASNASTGNTARAANAGSQAAAEVQLSQAALERAGASPAAGGSTSTSAPDPRMQLIISVLEAIFGKQIQISNLQGLGQNGSTTVSSQSDASSSASAAPAADGPGMIYTAQSTVTDTVSTSFQASGTVRTSDNREIHFNLSFSAQSVSQQSSSLTVRAGSALKDPLVLNFSNQSVQLSDQSFSFDLNNDGHMVQLPYIANGAYLALNPAGSQAVNQQTRLFGPSNGDGFSQLQTLDSDGNGWIDSADPASAQLGLITAGRDGKPVFTSLKDSPVGALYLGHASTSLPVASNNSSGLLRDSGLWLSNSGQAGTLQQVDLRV